MLETVGKVPISEHPENASVLGLAADSCKNRTLGCQFPVADAECKKVYTVCFPECVSTYDGSYCLAAKVSLSAALDHFHKKFKNPLDFPSICCYIILKIATG